MRSLQHPTFPDQQKQVNELVDLALVVAKAQRGENHLQSQEVIKGKFLAEIVELDEAKTRLDVLSEVADLVYYAVQDFAVAGDERDLHATVAHIAEKVDISVEDAYKVSLAKYHLRAYNPKNFAAENAAIEKTLDMQ